MMVTNDCNTSWATILRRKNICNDGQKSASVDVSGKNREDRNLQSLITQPFKLNLIKFRHEKAVKRSSRWLLICKITYRYIQIF